MIAVGIAAFQQLGFFVFTPGGGTNGGAGFANVKKIRGDR